MSFNVKDYIVVFENIVSESLCNDVINEYSNSPDWLNTSVSSGLQRNIRKCDAINISEQGIINKNYESRKLLDDELFKCASNALQKYFDKFPNSMVQQDSGYTLLRYQENEFYTQHTDHFLQQPRSVSCSLALNDGYDGGEFGFFDREIIIKAPKGAAIMFPSNFMYPHEIMPVTRGVRYSIITWFV